MEDKNTEGNNSLETKVDETSTQMKVEGEEVQIYSKVVDGKKEIDRIEFPENRKDDKEWQEKAIGTINLTAQKNKLNLENKKLAVELEQKTADLNAATKALSDIGGSSSKDLEFDLTAGIMKELNLNSVEELAEADKSDITKATKKVTEAYQNAVVKTTKGTAMTKVMVDTIMDENEPAKVNEFIQFVKSLGVSPTMEIYKTWKTTQKAGSKEQKVEFNALSGFQAANIPFLPVGESHESLSGTKKIEKETAEIMLGALSQV